MTMPRSFQIQEKISRLLFTRRVTLAAIVMTGAMVVAVDSASSQWKQERIAESKSFSDRVHSYSGIGVELERQGGEHIIRRVFANSPAEGQIFPGATLVAVNDLTPGCTQGWASMIRGPVGTELQLTVSYDDGAPQKVTLKRDVIRIRY